MVDAIDDKDDDKPSMNRLRISPSAIDEKLESTENQQQQYQEQHQEQRRPPTWRVWKTIEKLQQQQDMFYPHITTQVISILREWGTTYGNDPKWKSFLDKPKLFNEVEESIIAIHYLLKGTTAAKSSIDTIDKYVAIDVCGGKGFFSLLLSYLRQPLIDHIILLEKADIDWYHIDESNKSATQHGRPLIVIWKNTNLHDYDIVLGKLLSLQYPVALTGIHLCKQLSPSFIGIVNGLGKSKCIYACLAPCCLPRAVTSQKKLKQPNATQKPKPKSYYSISIQLYETLEKRKRRLDYAERRERLKHKPTEGPCYHCGDISHNLRDCQILPTLPKEEQIRIRQAWHAATVPCWNCLQFGHYKADCPKLKEKNNDKSNNGEDDDGRQPQEEQQSHLPPMLCLDVSNVLQSEKPYSTYCHVLASDGIQKPHIFDVIETELTQNDHVGIGDREGKKKKTQNEKTKNQKHENDKNNWNSERKSIFLVTK